MSYKYEIRECGHQNSIGRVGLGVTVTKIKGLKDELYEHNKMVQDSRIKTQLIR